MIRSKLLTAIGDSDGGGNIYIGEKEFLSPGFYYWNVPLSVTQIHVCCIGAGAYNDYALTTTYSGGGGGGLVWTNDIPVTPGAQLLIRVGGSDAGIDESRHSTIGTPKENAQDFDEIFVQAFGGLSSGPGGGYDLQGRAGGGGIGGAGSGPTILQFPNGTEVWGGSGGGAAGYTGSGGYGVVAENSPAHIGGAGGGSAGGATYYRQRQGSTAGFGQGSAGGGTGVNGAGASGPAQPVQGQGATPARGQPGSSGNAESFGAGGACLYNQSPQVAPEYAKPGGGAVRIIWGIRYSYPNNADVSQ